MVQLQAEHTNSDLIAVEADYSRLVMGMVSMYYQLNLDPVDMDNTHPKGQEDLSFAKMGRTCL